MGEAAGSAWRGWLPGQGVAARPEGGKAQSRLLAYRDGPRGMRAVAIPTK